MRGCLDVVCAGWYRNRGLGRDLDGELHGGRQEVRSRIGRSASCQARRRAHIRWVERRPKPLCVVRQGVCRPSLYSTVTRNYIRRRACATPPVRVADCRSRASPCAAAVWCFIRNVLHLSRQHNATRGRKPASSRALVYRASPQRDLQGKLRRLPAAHAQRVRASAAQRRHLRPICNRVR